MREFSSGMFGHFKGYSEDEMTLIKTLCEAGAAEHLIPGVAIPTRKEGCTCGQCIGGWLSPRMSLRYGLAPLVCLNMIVRIVHPTQNVTESCSVS